MGYVDDKGVYHKEVVAMQRHIPARSTIWKQGDHDRQRADHKRDLIRPYNPDGTPNEAFIEQYPEESKYTYKFIPDDEQIAKEQ